MTTTTTNSTTVPARAIEVIASLVMLFAAVGIVAAIVGHTGLGLASDPIGDSSVLSVPVEIDRPVDVGSELDWTDGPDGTVDADTGKPPVELSGPVVAQLGFLAPTAAERVAYTAWQVSGAALALAVAWLIRGMAQSTRTGHPFTRANERRLRRIAGIVAVGGMAYLLAGEVLRTWLVHGSAAEDLVAITLELNFLPLVVGIGIGLLAGIWRVGVNLTEDVEGMI